MPRAPPEGWRPMRRSEERRLSLLSSSRGDESATSQCPDSARIKGISVSVVVSLDRERSSVLRLIYPMLAVFSVLSLAESAHALYVYPEVEYVPTERLIENLERFLRDGTVESDEIRAGEELDVRTMSLFFSRPSEAPEDAALTGTFRVQEDGFITLGDAVRAKVAGLSVDEASEAVREAVKRAGKDTLLEVTQTRAQRSPRLLPGESLRARLALARVHSIAAFQLLEAFQVDLSDGLPFLGFDESANPSSVPSEYGAGDARAKPSAEQRRSHLERAIDQYRMALQQSPEPYDVMTAQLGLAWCLDQLGERDTAVAEYRKAFRLALDFRQQTGYLVREAFATEIAGYLKGVLDPIQDQDEIHQLDEYLAQTQQAPRAITPIVVPLTENDSLDALVDANASVPFDLDGSGTLQRWGWIHPNAAWLVHDPADRGEVSSGLQLFGGVTFWIFWRDGYDALGALDDNADGEIMGDELDGLALWRDANGNGRSESDEVRSVRDAGIVSLSTHSERHPSEIPYSPTGVTWVSGEVRPTYDWIVRAEQDSAAPLH